MLIDPLYFSLIDKRLKTVEARLYRGPYIDIEPQDKIQFLDISDQKRALVCQVMTKTLYTSFGQMLATEGVEKCLPGVLSIDEGIRIYMGFTDYQEQSKVYPVVAFHIQLN